MIQKINLLIVTLIFISCSTQITKNEANNSREYQLGAYLWQQRSGEYRALCYQAYNMATKILAEDLQNKHNKKRAVIFDIDETVLDNSFGGAYDIKNNIPWSPNSFNEWVKKIKSEAIPGAKKFIDFAFLKQVEVFYISNRTTDQIEDTIENFKKLGIQAKKENLIFMSKDWDKKKRRIEIEKKYEVVLYFGDNLHDFNSDYENKTSDEREKLADRDSGLFGVKYIVFPNPLYGDWENSLPNKINKYDLLLIK